MMNEMDMLPSSHGEAQVLSSHVDRERKKQQKERDWKEKKKRWRGTLRLWFHKLMALFLPPTYLEMSREDGRYPYERVLVDFYFDYFHRILWGLGAIAFFILLYFVAIYLYVYYMLAMPPPTTFHLDDTGRLIENIRTPHLLSPDHRIDAYDLEWVRDTELKRLTSAVSEHAWIEYLWRDGNRYNITMYHLKQAFVRAGKDCVCAAHLGIPLHAVYIANVRGEDTVMLVEPRVQEVATGALQTWIYDSLTPSGIHLRSPVSSRVTHYLPEGLGRHEFGKVSTLCIVRCSAFAERRQIINDDGTLIE